MDLGARSSGNRRSFACAVIVVAFLFANVSLGARAAFAADDSAGRGYVRPCTGMASRAAAGQPDRPDVAQHEAQFAQLDAGNDALARLVQRRLSLTAPPQVIVRHVEKVLGPRLAPAPADEAVLLSDLAPSAPRWWLAIVEQDQSLVSAVVANPKDVRESVGFARGMAAYALVNDLLGGDETVPRDGCRALFAKWFGSFPGVLPTIDAALSATPPDDPDFDARVSSAWKVLTAGWASKDAATALTGETIARVGSSPAVAAVYRDAGLPGDGLGPIDVVRIGGPAHTYLIVPDSVSAIRLGDIPLCVVGDKRCSSYYVWP
jgi:hypothetical protein